MSTTGTQPTRSWTGRDLLTGVLLLVGAGLAGTGTYLHVSIAAQVRAGACDGCTPWHPLFVLAPLIVGTAITLLAGYLLFRR